MVPLDQISPNHDWILSQSNKQRKMLTYCTKLSVDNNHKCSPSFVFERTSTLRELLHGHEWITVGDVLCLTKPEELHTQVT